MNRQKVRMAIQLKFETQLKLREEEKNVTLNFVYKERKGGQV